MFSDLIRGCYSGAKLLKSTPSRTPYATRPRINRNKVSKSSANYKAKNVVLFYFVCCRALLVQGGGKTRGWERPRGWDDETTRLRDCGTTRPRDHGTTGLRDPLKKHRRSQAFPGVLSCAELCEAACRESGADVVPSRSLAGWGCTWRTSPFRRTSLVPQMRRYHDKGDAPLSRQGLGVRRAPSATLGKNAVDG